MHFGILYSVVFKYYNFSDNSVFCPCHGVGSCKNTSEQDKGDLFLYTSNKILEVHTNDKKENILSDLIRL